MPYEVLDGGVSVDWAVAQRVMAIEDRGGRFHVERGSIRVEPSGVLTGEDRAYLVARKPEVLKILKYRSPTMTQPSNPTAPSPSSPGTNPVQPSSSPSSPGHTPSVPTTPNPTPSAPSTPKT